MAAMASSRDGKRLRSGLDLDAVIFDGDRELSAELRRDPAIREVLRRLSPAAKVAGLRRDLLLSSLKLSARIAPEMFRAIERVTSALKLEASVEAYCVSSADMNAFIAPPEDERVLIGVSSPLLEKMDEDELAFVLGHELGHVLFDHFRMAPSQLLDLDERLPPLQIARLYAWMRYAELSADRTGLIACRDVDAAIRAFFKLTSGLCDKRFLENAREAARQLDALAKAESTEQDWFSTHPYGPLRIKAIEAFSRSAGYHSILGRVGGDMSEAALEEEVRRIMALMDPSFTDGSAECHAEIKELLVVGGLIIALADGSLDRSEQAEIDRLLGGHLRLDDETLAQMKSGAGEKRLAELGRHLALRLSPVRRKKILEDLTAIAMADEQLAAAERDALLRCARHLGVHPSFVDETLARIGSALD